MLPAQALPVPQTRLKPRGYQPLLRLTMVPQEPRAARSDLQAVHCTPDSRHCACSSCAQAT